MAIMYDNIIEVHWRFLDAEESMEKINLRRQLEDLIFQHLNRIPHEEKFLLPPTAHVLKSSIAKLDDFSAYKASIGFEAISQYANNLFTKPWRKEYRIIKMYSGFYQHEVAANLIDAEVLFEAMGYRVMPNQTLVLDGPVCPDRVTNVSRDAITANVECQIMKDIYRELTEMSLVVHWSDIYSFRECNTMDVAQSVQQMAILIQEKLQKTQQARRKQATYGAQLAPVVSSCNSCNAYPFHPHIQQQQPPLPHHHLGLHSSPMAGTQLPFCTPQAYSSNVPCSIHSQVPGMAYGYPHAAYNHFTPGYHHLPNPSSTPQQTNHVQTPALGTIPHSKSLEHYQDPAAMYQLTACMQRHSIDQTPFDYASVAASSASHYGGPMGMAPPSGVYDAVDGCNLPAAAYTNHPYNVSGNRFPLPYNISSGFAPPYMNGGGNVHHSQAQQQQQQHPSSIMNGFPQPSHMPPYYHHCRSNSSGHLYGLPTVAQPPSVDRMTNSQTPTSILSKKKSSYDDYDVPSTVRHVVDGKPHHHHHGELIYIDTKEDSSRKERKKSDRSLTTADLLLGGDDYESDMLPATLVERQQQSRHHHYLHHQVSHNSRQSDFDSYEDEHTNAMSGTNAYQQRASSNVSKRISNKNQDGIGSYESWNYVFQKLEKQGINKDLGDRGDLLGVVDTMDGNPGGGMDEEEFLHQEGTTSRGGTLKRQDKLKALKHRPVDRVDGIVRPSSASYAARQQQAERENERNEARSSQKTTTAPSLVQKVIKPSSGSSSSNNQPIDQNHSRAIAQANNNGSSSIGASSRKNSTTRKLVNTTSSAGLVNNREISNAPPSSGGILINHHNNNASSSTTGRKKSTSFNTAAATIINPQDEVEEEGDRNRNNKSNPAPAEWNCEFCTFLNPETRRICEICAKSRDFNLNAVVPPKGATSNGTATCV